MPLEGYRLKRAEAFRALEGWLGDENWSDPDCAMYCLTLYTLMRGLAPQLVYEVGVWRGDSTAATLAALERSGGRLVSCDVDDYDWSISDAEWRGRWEFRQMPSLAFADSLNEQADVIYVDGNHEYDVVREEVAAFWPLLKVGGHLVMHDTSPREAGPWQVLEMLLAFAFEAFELPWAHGFGLLRKRGADPGYLAL